MWCVWDEDDDNKKRAAAGMGGCLPAFIPGHARGGFIRSSLLPELTKWSRTM